MSNFISLEKAKKMTSTYKQMKEVVLKDEHKSVLPLSETFDRFQFDAVLANSECVGLRIYYGMNEDNVLHSIIVGVNRNGDDILDLPTSTSMTNVTMTSTNAIDPTDPPPPPPTGIIEDGNTCPPVCGSGGL